MGADCGADSSTPGGTPGGNCVLTGDLGPCAQQAVFITADNVPFDLQGIVESLCQESQSKNNSIRSLGTAGSEMHNGSSDNTIRNDSVPMANRRRCLFSIAWGGLRTRRRFTTCPHNFRSSGTFGKENYAASGREACPTVIRCPIMDRRQFLALASAPVLAQTSSRLRGRGPREIAASPFGVGFETLDRKLFDDERVYPHLATLGAKWARVQTGWVRCETSRGVYDFAWLDRIVDRLRGMGVQPWFSVGFGHPLYTPGAERHMGVGWVPLNSDEARQGWQRFVERAAEHFRGRVRHWEIWNEPNGATFWRPSGKPDVKGYVELVRMTAPRIRRAIPDAVLVGGAFMRFPIGMEYFEQCMDAGLGTLVDRISYHGYRAQPEKNYLTDVRSFRAFLKRYNPRLEVWNGENGAPSVTNGVGGMSDLAWTEATQARWLLRRALTDFALEVELTSYFHAADMPDYGRITYGWPESKGDTTNSKGLIRGRDYTPKPSYYAYRNVCALFDADTNNADLLLRFDRGAPAFEEAALRQQTYTRAGRPVYVFWYPSDLQQAYAPRRARAMVWNGAAARMDNPVVVDLLTGEIRKPPKVRRFEGFWHFEEMPVEDYPLLITDASVVA
jgi:polysaccharide biosynthesis protein PslG